MYNPYFVYGMWGGYVPMIIKEKGDYNLNEDNVKEIKDNKVNNVESEDEWEYAIRKLTCEECFILQGMTKEDVQKARDMGISNSQLYKIAGNGLSCSVIQFIFEHIYKATVDNDYQTTDERMVEAGYGV